MHPFPHIQGRWQVWRLIIMAIWVLRESFSIKETLSIGLLRRHRSPAVLTLSAAVLSTKGLLSELWLMMPGPLCQRRRATSLALCLSSSFTELMGEMSWPAPFYPFLGARCFKRSLTLPVHMASRALVKEIVRNNTETDVSDPEAVRALGWWENRMTFWTQRERKARSVLICSSSNGPRWFYFSIIWEVRYWKEPSRDSGALTILVATAWTRKPTNKLSKEWHNSSSLYPRLPWTV